MLGCFGPWTILQGLQPHLNQTGTYEDSPFGRFTRVPPNKTSLPVPVPPPTIAVPGGAAGYMLENWRRTGDDGVVFVI